MKKITLLLFAVLTFSLLSNAQTLNQPASWPNASWTLTGTYAPAGLLSNPTVAGTTFTWDDDLAGSASDDVLQVTSPVIDLTAASMAGETSITISGDFVYRALGGDVLAIEIYNADAATWTSVQTFVGNSMNTNYQTCTGAVPYTTTIIDIAGYTATQLSGFQYRFSYNDQAGWQWGWCLTSPTIVSASPLTDELDYYNLQFPATGTISAGQEFIVYAQAYEAGLTDVTSGQAPGIQAWIGYSTANTDPSSGGWTWIVATFLGEVGNNDEYSLDLGASIPAIGTFYYASRWSLNTAPFTYGGIQANASYGGEWGTDNNISGVLTINGPSNDDCSGAVALTPGTVFEDNVLTGQTQLGSTDSGETPLPSCSIYDPADPSGFGGDVWYSVVVPADGNIFIETQGDPSGDGGDSGMSVYSGSCGALAELDCDDDSSTDGFYSLITITDPTLANQTLYIRVFEYSGNSQLRFQVSAYSATLSVDEFENANAFTYFPNPVNNELKLRAQSNIQNVLIYNMLGQEVLRTSPNAFTSDVSMSELQTGAYFVKVKINDTTETIRVIKQ